MGTAHDLTAAQLEEYRREFRHREERKRDLLEQRRSRAWEIARMCSESLRNRYGVGRVIVFGSLARGSDFSAYSDVDLLVWGLDAGDLYRAVSDALAYRGEVEVNLVPAEACRGELRAAAESEGVEL